MRGIVKVGLGAGVHVGRALRHVVHTRAAALVLFLSMCFIHVLLEDALGGVHLLAAKICALVGLISGVDAQVRLQDALLVKRLQTPCHWALKDLLICLHKQLV